MGRGPLTPWNGSPWFIAGKTASALAAGCSVVVKPRELCALRWRHVDLKTGTLTVKKGIDQYGVETTEKDTKSHNHAAVGAVVHGAPG